MSATTLYPADLHVHSIFSDGLRSPEELTAMADRLGLRVIALCDHDTLDGLEPMAKAIARRNAAFPHKPPLLFLPSLELSAGIGGRTHILGYGVNPRDPELARCLQAAREDRQSRAEAIVDKLEQLGVSFPEEERRALCSPTVGRAHIARALVRMRVVNTVQQAFDRYLAEGKSAYVARQLLPATEAVRLLKTAGAIPVLAHPCRLSPDFTVLAALTEALEKEGLTGLEAWHPSATPAQALQLSSYAKRRALLVTGGSDFHGDLNTRVSMGRMPSGWRSCQADVQALLGRTTHE
ncbi:MAG: PHP domain-containing protein [Eubacteriales bacterium]|nr:PHP domain-containing protein [Eubacteriales bacterium]